MTNMKANKIRLLSFSTPPMRAFHMTWLAFFVCFFGWFGLAPLMPLVRADLGLSKSQVADSMIAAVAGTIFARLLVGYLCDKLGPRRMYAALLALGALPIMGVGLVHGYTSFLICRVLIGLVGASFVITQYHTSAMFAPNVVGTANATTAGWQLGRRRHPDGDADGRDGLGRFRANPGRSLALRHDRARCLDAGDVRALSALHAGLSREQGRQGRDGEVEGVSTRGCAGCAGVGVVRGLRSLF